VNYWRRAGFYWVPSAGVGTYTVQRQYVPNLVAVQKPQTTYVARAVNEQTPVQVTRYVDEVVCEKVPVKVCRMQQTEEIRQIPVTVQKPVTERVNYKVPVRTCRWVQQEMVRKIPVTTQRTVYEERVEQVPVRVCRMVAEARTVQQPRTVATWKPYQSTRCVPRTVVMRVPLDPCYSGIPSTTSYYYPSTSITTAPPAPPTTITRRVETEPEPEPELADPGDGSVVESVLQQAEADATSESEGAESDQPASEPKDSDETGEPILNLESLEINPPGPVDDTNSSSSETSA
jgi:hypothetical protein